MKMVTGAALLIAAASSLTACSTSSLYPSFDAEPSDAVQGYRCPPIKTYSPETIRRAASMVEPGTVVDRMLNDYHLMRKLCSDEV